tara:strand:+ start:133 stop:948 length:816 start_codon:yes stop_codon:yes gene_type:complete
MTRRKNVKRIDPRYFLNETVNRNDDGSQLEEDLEEGIFSYDDSGRLRAKELDAADLDASGEERLAFEKDPRAHSRDPRTIDRSNVATNPPGKQDIHQFLKQDHPEIWAAWTQKQEIEEGFKDFVQGAKDTFKDITKGRKLGKTREYRKQADAERKEYEAEEAKIAARRAARLKRGAEMDKAQAAAREKERSPEAMARRARESERRYRDSMRLTPDEKRRAAQERDAKFKSKQYDKDQERMGYKDKRVGNVASASSGFAGRSGKLREQDSEE